MGTKKHQMETYPLGWVDIPVEKLVKADWNYKEEDSSMSQSLIANLKRNGQIVNTVVRLLPTGFYEVVDGNHRLDAFHEVGIKVVHCYNCGEISIQEAIRKAIELNETKFKANQILLGQRIAEIWEHFDNKELLDTMPYSPEELDNLRNLSDFDWGQFGSETSGEGDPNTLSLRVQYQPEDEQIAVDIREIVSKYKSAKIL